MMKQMFSQVKAAVFFNVWKTETQGKDLQCALMLLLDRDSRNNVSTFADKVNQSYSYSVR